YIKNLENKIKNNPKKDDLDEALTVIKFFQHERLVHLFVTLFYALFSILFTFLITQSKCFIPVALILYVFLIFYIIHYFHLENGVQYLYKQYDKLKELSK
ncbi:MAG: hypothetical protein II091_01790, partial [Lachnospiraceae bacterium]|nr:hypothetical protein [Lachnospiraceae bacterium]